MPQDEFLATNVGRAYPLFTDTAQAVFPVLADAKIVVAADSGYVHGKHTVQLTTYGTLDSVVAANLGVDPGPFAVLTCTAPTLQGIALLFPLGDLASFSRIVAVAYDAAQLQITLAGGAATAAIESVKFSGWVAYGDRQQIPEAVLSVAVPMEPAKVLVSPESVGDPGSTYVYNQRVTQYEAPADCAAVADPGIAAYVLACGPLNGPVYLLGGHSTRVNQDSRDNLLTISADGGGGELGKSCSPVPIAPDVFDDAVAPKCNEVLRQINGVGGPSISLTGFSGVITGYHPDLNRVVLATSGSDLVICPVNPANEPTTFIPTQDGVACGDNGELPIQPGVPDDGTGFIDPEVQAQRTQAMNLELPLAPPKAISACEWEARDGQWELINYPCKESANCMQPDDSALPNGRLFTPCLYMPADKESGLRNGDLMDDIPFAGWFPSTGVELIQDHERLPTPIAAFTGADNNPIVLRQNSFAVMPGTYVFQMHAYTPEGYFTVRIRDGIKDTVIHEFSHAGLTGELQLAVCGPFQLEHALISVEIAYLAESPATGYAGFFALVKQ